MHSLCRIYPKYFLLKLSVLSIGIMLPVWYLLFTRFPVWMDYVLRAMLLSQSSHQIWLGDFYPRWLMDVNDGLGSPVMLFQPNLSTYFAALLEPLAPLDPHGFGRVLLLMSLFLFLGGAGCYVWLKQHFDENHAQSGAFLYAFFPLQIPTVYSIMSPHTAFAIALFPWMLFAAKKMLTEPARYFPHYCFFQAALMFTSLWNTLVFGAVPLAYVLFLSEAQQRVKNTFFIVLAAIAGCMVAGIYWYPLFANKDFILYQEFTKSYFHYSHNFLSIIKSPEKTAGMFFNPWVAFCISIIPLLVAGAMLKKDIRSYRTQEYLFFVAVIIGAIFMCFSVSKLVWENLGFLENIQFPIRFMNMAIPAIVFVATCWLSRIKNFGMFYAVALLTAATYFLFVGSYRYVAELDPYWANVSAHKFVPQNAHMTIWMQKAGIEDPLNPPPQYVNVPPSRLIEGSAKIKEIKQDISVIRFKANVISPSALVTLKRYYYPGWVAPKEIPGIVIKEHAALLAVQLPQGRYDVTLKQPWFPGEKNGLLISSVGLAIVCLWAYVNRRYRKRIW